jgi:hypothetical protein
LERIEQSDSDDEEKDDYEKYDPEDVSVEDEDDFSLQSTQSVDMVKKVMMNKRAHLKSPSNNLSYVVGIAGFLQKYNGKKKMQKLAKRLQNPDIDADAALSATNPLVYADRFSKGIKSLFKMKIND